MDVLSDILRILKFNTSVYFRTRLRAPWWVTIPERPPVVRFHIVIAGRCWGTVPGLTEAIALGPGDVLVVARGQGHELYSDAGAPRQPLETLLAQADFDGMTLSFGGRGPQTQLLCGHFEFDEGVSHPMLSSFPGHVSLSPTADTGLGWLAPLLQLIERESKVSRPGAATALNRLTEVLFIQVLRAFMADPRNETSFMIGLRDRFVGEALRRLHRRPGHAWTVDELAHEVGLSRTALSLRFVKIIGLAPAQYLTRWRMQLARTALLGSKKSLALIGEELGYRSEAAFNRVFKRHFGVGPGRYRRLQAPASLGPGPPVARDARRHAG